MNDVEEDIKILETLTKIEYDYAFGTKIYKPHGLSTEEVDAIKNLINRVKELEEYKKIAELTKISCCTARNCAALSNSIKDSLENMKLKERLKDLEQIEAEHQKINEELNNAIGKEYQLGYGQGEYEVNEYWKTKIREKIEELKSKSGGKVFHIQQTINAEMRLLEELLEKRK